MARLVSAIGGDLKSLASVCEPATFGMNNRNVLNESYRKAGNMDSYNFGTKLDVDKFGIVDRVPEQLMEGPDLEKAVNAELYKLNVEGHFFQVHKDTPRSENKSGSLVVVFPTPHEGVLSHFDTSTRNGPSTQLLSFVSTLNRPWRVSPFIVRSIMKLRSSNLDTE